MGGSTASTDFPTRHALQPACALDPDGVCQDAFIAKLNATGSGCSTPPSWAGAAVMAPMASLWTRRVMPMWRAVPAPPTSPPGMPCNRPAHSIRMASAKTPLSPSSMPRALGCSTPPSWVGAVLMTRRHRRG